MGFARLDRMANVAIVLAAVASGAIILTVGRGLTFSTLGDEWTFIQTRSLQDPSTWLPAHNEHWPTAFVFLFRGIFEIVGFASYLPYLIVLVGLHLAIATALYRLARGQTYPSVAAALTIPFLMLGSGWENLLIFFQAAILMAVATGLWALVALRTAERRGVIVAAILLVVGVMSVTTSVLFLVAAATELVAARRTRDLVAVLPAAGVFAAWSVVIGPIPVAGQSNALALETVADVASFMFLELLNTVGAILGGGVVAGVAGAPLLVGGIGLIAFRDRSRLWKPAVLGPAVGLLVGFLLIAVGRRHLGIEAAAYSRYVYVSAALLLLVAAPLVGRPHVAWSPRARRWALISGFSSSSSAS